MPEQEFVDRVNGFIVGCREIYDRYMAQFPNNSKETFAVRNWSAKFLAIDRQYTSHKGSCIHCFIAVEDGQNKTLGPWKKGDIFKAASYKVPAKHARGNLYNDDGGLDCMTATGPRYLNQAQ